MPNNESQNLSTEQERAAENLRQTDNEKGNWFWKYFKRADDFVDGPLKNLVEFRWLRNGVRAYRLKTDDAFRETDEQRSRQTLTKLQQDADSIALRNSFRHMAFKADSGLLRARAGESVRAAFTENRWDLFRSVTDLLSLNNFSVNSVEHDHNHGDEGDDHPEYLTPKSRYQLLETVVETLSPLLLDTLDNPDFQNRTNDLLGNHRFETPVEAQAARIALALGNSIDAVPNPLRRNSITDGLDGLLDKAALLNHQISYEGYVLRHLPVAQEKRLNPLVSGALTAASTAMLMSGVSGIIRDTYTPPQTAAAPNTTVLRAPDANRIFEESPGSIFAWGNAILGGSMLIAQLKSLVPKPARDVQTLLNTIHVAGEVALFGASAGVAAVRTAEKFSSVLPGGITSLEAASVAQTGAVGLLGVGLLQWADSLSDAKFSTATGNFVAHLSDMAVGLGVIPAKLQQQELTRWLVTGLGVSSASAMMFAASNALYPGLEAVHKALLPEKPETALTCAALRPNLPESWVATDTHLSTALCEEATIKKLSNPEFLAAFLYLRQATPDTLATMQQRFHDVRGRALKLPITAEERAAQTLVALKVFPSEAEARDTLQKVDAHRNGNYVGWLTAAALASIALAGASAGYAAGQSLQEGNEAHFAEHKEKILALLLKEGITVPDAAAREFLALPYSARDYDALRMVSTTRYHEAEGTENKLAKGSTFMGFLGGGFSLAAAISKNKTSPLADDYLFPDSAAKNPALTRLYVASQTMDADGTINEQKAQALQGATLPSEKQQAVHQAIEDLRETPVRSVPSPTKEPTWWQGIGKRVAATAAAVFATTGVVAGLQGRNQAPLPPLPSAPPPTTQTITPQQAQKLLDFYVSPDGQRLQELQKRGGSAAAKDRYTPSNPSQYIQDAKTLTGLPTTTLEQAKDNIGAYTDLMYRRATDNTGVETKGYFNQQYRDNVQNTSRMIQDTKTDLKYATQERQSQAVPTTEHARTATLLDEIRLLNAQRADPDMQMPKMLDATGHALTQRALYLLEEKSPVTLKEVEEIRAFISAEIFEQKNKAITGGDIARANLLFGQRDDSGRS